MEGNTDQSLYADISTQTEDTAGCLQADDSKRKDVDSVATLVKILNDKTKLNNFTGLHSFELLDALVECVSDLPVEKSNRKKDMILKNRILLTFCKLKQNLSFTSLAILFNIPRQTCVNYFKSTISTLAVVLETMISWPSQDEIRGNLPYAFKNYQNTRIILDCAETSIEKSKCLRCRILTYSNYKGRHTSKDVGVAPSGLITHVSKSYGGRSSDKLIVNHSRILNKLDYQDAVMVDKGYRIEEECLKVCIFNVQQP